MHRQVRLRDEIPLVIRSMDQDDVDRSFAFFESLSPEDRAYLRRDGWDREVVEERIRAMGGSGSVERIVALVGDRTVADAARSIFRKLGFHEETVLPDYVKDLEGHKQDMILMRCDLQALQRELEDSISTWDWQRTD